LRKPIEVLHIQVDDLSHSLIAFEQISTSVIVVEFSQSSWLAADVVPRRLGAVRAQTDR
jgi:hypothetical protein